MHITFDKIHGAGNDFVVFDDRDTNLNLSPEQVKFICNRHFGIGADGLIQVRQSSRPECAAYMHYLNADGSLAEMCGNGVRCFARFLVEHKLLSDEELDAQAFIADTLAGPRPLAFEVDATGAFVAATVEMGEPVFVPEQIPTTLLPTREITLYDSKNRKERLEPAVVQARVQSKQVDYALTCVNMGNPHAVIFLEYVDVLTAQVFAQEPSSIDLDEPGASFESNTELFPQKTNVELAVAMGNNRVKMRVYERGVGETLACGTGACAVAVTAVILGKAKREEPIDLELPGGTLEVVWLPNNKVRLRGPAQTVFSGVMTLE